MSHDENQARREAHQQHHEKYNDLVKRLADARRAEHDAGQALRGGACTKADYDAAVKEYVAAHKALQELQKHPPIGEEAAEPVSHEGKHEPIGGHPETDQDDDESASDK